MNYKVHDTARGHIFATLKEARQFAEDIRRASRVIVAITETRAAVTHTYIIKEV